MYHTRANSRSRPSHLVLVWQNQRGSPFNDLGCEAVRGRCPDCARCDDHERRLQSKHLAPPHRARALVTQIEFVGPFTDSNICSHWNSHGARLVRFGRIWPIGFKEPARALLCNSSVETNGDRPSRRMAQPALELGPDRFGSHSCESDHFSASCCLCSNCDVPAQFRQLTQLLLASSRSHSWRLEPEARQRADAFECPLARPDKTPLDIWRPSIGTRSVQMGESSMGFGRVDSTRPAVERAHFLAGRKPNDRVWTKRFGVGVESVEFGWLAGPKVLRWRAADPNSHGRDPNVCATQIRGRPRRNRCLGRCAISDARKLVLARCATPSSRCRRPLPMGPIFVFARHQVASERSVGRFR